MFKILNLCNINYRVYNNGIIEREDNNRIIKPHKSKDGYLVVNVGIKNNRKCKYVHRLVAEAFIPTEEDIDKLTVNHKDFNKENNNVENLEWLSRELNCSDSYNQPRHGNVGSRNKNSKLTEEEVKTIKLILKTGNKTLEELAEMFKINKRTIQDIELNRTWKRVKI